MSYPNLHHNFDWKLGIHKAPAGYQHRWEGVVSTQTCEKT